MSENCTQYIFINHARKNIAKSMTQSNVRYFVFSLNKEHTKDVEIGKNTFTLSLGPRPLFTAEITRILLLHLADPEKNKYQIGTVQALS